MVQRPALNREGYKGDGNPQPRKMKRQKSGRALIRVSKNVADLLEDPTSLSEWDDEELRRGYRKDRHGRWTGRPPKVVPTACHQELTRRLFKQAQQTFNTNLPKAIEVLMSIINNPNSDDHAKLKAITIVLERTLGKTADKVDISVQPDEPQWMKAMREATVVGTEYDPVLDDVIEVESQGADE